MHRIHRLFSIVLLVTASAWSDDADMDTDWMKAIEDANKNLSSNIALKNAVAASADTKELEELFTKVEAHFVAKGDAHDAVDLSKKSLNLTRDISRSISAKDFDKATDSATTLSRACRTCHTFFKKS